MEAPPEKIPKIGIGLLGYEFMGKAHTNAYKKMPYVFWPPSRIPELVAICGRSQSKVSEAARRYGYSTCYIDWRAMIRDDRVQLFDNSAPNNIHRDPCILAAEAGKHLLCEKPIGRDAQEGWEMLKAARKSGVKHMVAFNYRFVPAIALAKKLIEERTLGTIYHFEAKYYNDWIMNPNFPLVWRLDKEIAGSGALGDIGSHLIDLAHFLVGAIKSVSSATKTFVGERPLLDNPSVKKKVEVDDAFGAILEFENGAVGTLSASRFCAGRRNYVEIEIYGSKGAIIFDSQKMNFLRLHLGVGSDDSKEPSFRDVLVTEQYHPFMGSWLPPGFPIGWDDTYTNEVYHLIDCIAKDRDVSPQGATFEDGYRCAVVCDAILRSEREEKKTSVNY